MIPQFRICHDLQWYMIFFSDEFCGFFINEEGKHTMSWKNTYIGTITYWRTFFSFSHVWTTCFVLSLFIGLGSKDISAIFLDSWWCHCIVWYQKFTTWVIHSILWQTWLTGKECDCPLQNDWLVSYEMISYFLTVDAFETSCHIISYFWFPPCSHYSSYHLHCSDAGRGNYQVFATLNLVNYIRSTVFIIIVVQFVYFSAILQYMYMEFN